MFTHQTARVKVTLTAGTGVTLDTGAASPTVELYGYKSITGNTPDTATGALTGNAADGKANAIKANKGTGYNYTAFLIPNTYTNVDFLKVTNSGTSYVWKPAGELKLEAGKSYSLTVTVKETALEVSVSEITDWDADSTYTGGDAEYVPPPPGMVYLRGGTITGSFSEDVFITGRTVTLSPFWIAKYETTYELWKQVYDWNVTEGKGYTFGSGWEGHEEAGISPGTGTSNEAHGWTAVQKKLRPVTDVSWRDVIVWCNAYSEKSNLQPVYYTDSTRTTMIKDSTISTACDNVYMDRTKNGYRLPTEAEWEYAARGGDTAAADWSYAWAGTDSEGQLGDYAWYAVNTYNLGNSHKDYGAHPVGTTKYGNRAGLYDMSGNVWEWCWDWYGTITLGSVENPVGASSGTDRVLRGGNWCNSAASVRSANRGSDTPAVRGSNLGFRLVRP